MPMPADRCRRAAITRACLWLLVIACGLALRRFGLGLGLSAPVVKYGGSVLWGTMVFFLLAMPLTGRSRALIAAAALCLAITVELSRLVHTPWLDDFRLTTAGALLLGRVFSFWNMVAYGCGIAAGGLLDLVWTGSGRILAGATPTLWSRRNGDAGELD
jgi:hypothetical protein